MKSVVSCSRKGVKAVTFGEYVRWARTSKNKRQDEVAEAVGMSPSALSKIENGLTELPRKQTVIALAEVLEADRDEMLVRAGYHVADQPTDDPKAAAVETLASLDRVLVTSGYSKNNADLVMQLVRSLAPEGHPLVRAMNHGQPVAV